MKGLPHSLETTPEKSERLVVARELPLCDVTIPNMQMEADSHQDVITLLVIITAYCTSFTSSEDGDSAVAHAHKEKLRKYEARCSAEAISFLPLAVDTFGGWHKVGLKTITRLGRQLARNLGKDEDEVVRHLRQRLGVLIARDNAAMMASRHPTFATPEVDNDPD